MFLSLTASQLEWWKTAELNDSARPFGGIKTEVRQYLPDYIFSTWRQIRKNYPIEAFDYNVYSGVAERVVLWRITATVNVSLNH